MGEDEKLEIVFLWMGGDSRHPIESGLDDFLDCGDDVPAARRTTRRRRLPWPGRRAPRPGAAAT